MKTTNRRRSTEWLHGGSDFAIYAVGLLVVVIGAAVCYVLALLGRMAEADAAFALTIVAAVGFIPVTVGVVLRARRQGKEIVDPLIFALGLFVALTGSLTIYTLALYQAVSERNALIGLTPVMILATLLSSMGVVWRTYLVERGEARRVVMGPLHKIYTRRIEEYQNEQDK